MTKEEAIEELMGFYVEPLAVKFVEILVRLVEENTTSFELMKIWDHFCYTYNCNSFKQRKVLLKCVVQEYVKRGLPKNHIKYVKINHEI